MHIEEDFEQIFNQDSRQKKTIGRGIHNRASRTRKHESVVMPSDRLDKKSVPYRNTVKPGIVRTTSLKEIARMELLDRIKQGDLPSMQEIDDYSEQHGFEAAQELVAEIRRLFNGTELCKLWGTYNGKVVDFCLGKYQVTKVPSTGDILVGQAALDFMSKKNKAAKESKTANAITIAQPMTPVPVEGHEHASGHEIRQPLKIHGFQIQAAKECSSEELYKLLDRLGAFVDREDDQQYYVEITIRELPR